MSSLWVYPAASALPSLTNSPPSAVHRATSIDVSVFAADVRDYDSVKPAVDEVGLIGVLLLNHDVFVALVVVVVGVWQRCVGGEVKWLQLVVMVVVVTINELWMITHIFCR
ncbi:hypothetical protein PIB30_014797 [Stylosanthes scabra]|uniref:Uncharacterized protein n=1 Tax=Stylosanthes scabra TaxID=79078 RepID=A0ABU6Z3H0_9FABA|nr:hypothetical protein [Stylosanthes scabra]